MRPIIRQLLVLRLLSSSKPPLTLRFPFPSRVDPNRSTQPLQTRVMDRGGNVQNAEAKQVFIRRQQRSCCTNHPGKSAASDRIVLIPHAAELVFAAFAAHDVSLLALRTRSRPPYNFPGPEFSPQWRPLLALRRVKV